MSDMEEIAALVLLSHADSHPGPFGKCDTHLCPVLRRKLAEYVGTEVVLRAVRGAR